MNDTTSIPSPRAERGDLPATLAKPRRDPEDVRMWAGVIVGGSLLALTVALLVVGLAQATLA